MTDAEVDKVLEKASVASAPVEGALLRGIADSINSSLRPVRPMPPTWMLTAVLAAICTALSVAAAALGGFYGIANLSPWKRALIFSTLGILLWGTGSQFTAQFIPGSRQRLSAGAMLAIGITALLGVFALAFRDYRVEHFISAGIACLLMGLLLAIPAGLLSWLLLRRGFAVNSAAAGLAGGTLAGLCGVTLLELHCANFQAAHVLVWHCAVVPVSAAVGALVGRLIGAAPGSRVF